MGGSGGDVAGIAACHDGGEVSSREGGDTGGAGCSCIPIVSVSVLND